MGRPKRYATPAERQAAYRQRLAQEMVPVNRAALTQWEARITALMQTIRGAARANEPLACAINHQCEAGILENLIGWFNQHGKEASTTENTD